MDNVEKVQAQSDTLGEYTHTTTFCVYGWHSSTDMHVGYFSLRANEDWGCINQEYCNLTLMVAKTTSITAHCLGVRPLASSRIMCS